MKRLQYTLFLLLLATFAALRAQSPLDTLAMRAIMVNQLFPQERVYLHFDNTAYYLGETMWFKAYVTSGIDNRATSISRVLYVEWWVESQERLHDTFTKSGVDYISVRTDQDYVKSLMNLFAKRN